jgi:hypothetical protein
MWWIYFIIGIIICVLVFAFSMCKSAKLADKAFYNAMQRQREALIKTITSGSSPKKE